MSEMSDFLFGSEPELMQPWPDYMDEAYQDYLNLYMRPLMAGAPDWTTSPMTPGAGYYIPGQTGPGYETIVPGLNEYMWQGITGLSAMPGVYGPYAGQALGAQSELASGAMQQQQTFMDALLRGMESTSGYIGYDPMQSLTLTPEQELANAELAAILTGTYTDPMQNPIWAQNVAAQEAVRNRAIADANAALATQYEATGLPSGSLMEATARENARISEQYNRDLAELNARMYEAERGRMYGGVGLATDIANAQRASQLAAAQLGLTAAGQQFQQGLGGLGYAGAQQNALNQMTLGQLGGGIGLMNALIQAGQVAREPAMTAAEWTFQDLMRQQQAGMALPGMATATFGVYPQPTYTQETGLLQGLVPFVPLFSQGGIWGSPPDSQQRMVHA